MTFGKKYFESKNNQKLNNFAIQMYPIDTIKNTLEALKKSFLLHNWDRVLIYDVLSEYLGSAKLVRICYQDHTAMEFELTKDEHKEWLKWRKKN